MSTNNTIVLLNSNTSVLDIHNILVLNGFMKFSERVKAARIHAKLSQEELALAVGLTQGLISKIERGDQEETAAVVKIAAACGVSPYWLDTGDGEMVVEYQNRTQFETQVFLAMQKMDAATQYQLVKISHSLAESDKDNGTSH